MTSRLKETYKNDVFKALVDKFNYANPMEVPKLEKITINIGLGEAKDNAKLMETAVKELGVISEQRNPSQTLKLDRACLWEQRLL